MENELENFYLRQSEPNQSCFLALRDIILNSNSNITADWKYKLPFFMYKGKMFCYLCKDKKTETPYIGIVNGSDIDHPQLESGNRKKMKTLSIDPTKDINLDMVLKILNLSAKVTEERILKKKKRKS
jgi:hypothetical protein